jgi:hypothetical protein
MKGDQGRLMHIYCYILHTGVEAAEEVHAGARDLPNQGPTPSRDGRLVR